MITEDFDPNRRAIINPEELIPVVPGFPRLAIGVFSQAIVAQAVKDYGGEEIALLKSVCGNFPVYRVEHGGESYALFLAAVGAPMAAGELEELGAMGARSFVFFGCCGVLDRSLDHGSIIVPTRAQRDEGVSYHYLPAGEFVELPYAGCAVQAMEKLGYPHVSGPTWTTDCMYRETAARMEKRRAQGCITVEMECAALAAVAEFRGYRFAQFLFAADNLDSPEWERRSLGDGGIPGYEIYMNAAFATAGLLGALEAGAEGAD